MLSTLRALLQAAKKRQDIVQQSDGSQPNQGCFSLVSEHTGSRLCLKVDQLAGSEALHTMTADLRLLAANRKRHLRVARFNLGDNDGKACNMRRKDDCQKVESALLPAEGGGLCNAAGKHP